MINLSQDTKNVLLGAGIPLVAFGLVNIIPHILLRRNLAKIPQSPQDTQKILESSGLPTDFPLINVPDKDVALYLYGKGDQLGPVISEQYNVPISESLAQQLKKHRSAILYGGRYSKLPIIAHEIGHAQTSTPLTRELIRLSTLGTFAGIPLWLFGKTKASQLSGIGLMMASWLPPLVNEYRANSRALEILKKIDPDRKDIYNAGKKTLAASFLSHTLPILMLAGGLATLGFSSRK